jgi:ankyrin repeat protein
LIVVAAIPILFCGCNEPSVPPQAPASSQVSKTPEAKSEPAKEDPQAANPSIGTRRFQEAALRGDRETVLQALQQGIRVDETDADGRTALMLAAFNGHTEIVKALLHHKAAVDTRDVAKRTALMFASSGPFHATVEVLLAAGSDVNAKDGIEGWTPLMFAAGEGQLEVVTLLLKHGAKPEIKDTDNETARDFAVRKGHTAVAELLAK